MGKLQSCNYYIIIHKNIDIAIICNYYDYGRVLEKYYSNIMGYYGDPIKMIM
jgi:hypothetical protein